MSTDDLGGKDLSHPRDGVEWQRFRDPHAAAPREWLVAERIYAEAGRSRSSGSFEKQTAW